MLSATETIDEVKEGRDVQFKIGERQEKDAEREESLQDEIGRYIEICFTEEIATSVLEGNQHVSPGEVATMRVYVTKELKRIVVVKDDILSAAEIRQHANLVTQAITDELCIWLENKCFKVMLLKEAQIALTSRYVAK